MKTSESSFSDPRVLKSSDLVLKTGESSFSEPRVLKISDLVLKNSESSFIESDGLPAQFGTLACIVFLKAGKQIDTGAYFQDRENA